AMLKVWSTDLLWTIINDTFQIYGGKAYFTDEPYERMMRDARINMIGEGANDVLRAFKALVGMRDVGLELKSVLEAIQHPRGRMSHLGRFASRRLGSLFAPPQVQVSSVELEDDAVLIARQVRELGRHVEWLLRTYQEEIVDRQHQLGRVADAATELYVSACVLKRLDRSLQHSHADERSRVLEMDTARY